MNKLRTASFFSGVGGIDLGFEQAGFKTVWANEIDHAPCETFRLNFDAPLAEKDVRTIEASDVPDFDVMIAGFPCQAFSVAGLRKGFDDDRGNLFFELERIFLAKKPEIVFLENVKNLATHDGGNTFKVISQKLADAGYHVKSKVLNACDYGNVPQNRERIYIVGFLDENACERFEFPDAVPLTTKLEDVIDYETKIDDKYYYVPEKFGKERYDGLTEAWKRVPDTVYQWRRVYARENKSGVCPTLTANMGGGGHNVPIVKTKNGFRKLTPRECFNVMGFPKDFKLPNQADAKLYKQAGNSVVVPVIRRIAEKIAEAVEKER